MRQKGTEAERKRDRERQRETKNYTNKPRKLISRNKQSKTERHCRTKRQKKSTN